MATPKISVIVPVYKAETYLHRCVDSILAQTFTDFEVLLIDDGSPDRSGEICDEYAIKDSRVRVIHKENGGVSSARQYGIDNALGEYTIHADPDDWVEPQMLGDLYVKAQKEDADMVICDFYVNYKDKQIYQKQQPSALDCTTVLNELFQQLHGSCGNKLLRRTCYKKYNVQFDKELCFCEDLYFHAKLLKNDISIAYLPRAYYHYDRIVNESSIVSNYMVDTFDYDEKLYKQFTHLLENSSALNQAQENFGYILVKRAFIGHIFSSSEFRDKCFKYKKYIWRKPKRFDKNMFFSSLLYFSCIGFYNIMYNTYQMLKK